MLKKPETCRECPLWGNGFGYVPDQKPEGASTMLVLPMPMVADVKAEAPVSLGALDREMFPLAGIDRETVAVSHVLRCRWGGGKREDDLPPASTLNAAVEHCRTHDTTQESVTLKVAVGELPWKTLAPGIGSLETWRGFLAPPEHGSNTRVLALKHPVTLKGAGTGLLEMKLDWQKVRRFHNGTWPQPLPPAVRWENGPEQAWLKAAASAPYVVIDTEYTWPQGWLTMIGLYSPGCGTLQWMRTDPNGASMARVTRELRALIAATPVVMHNSFADVPILEQNLGIRFEEYKRIDDSMLLDSVLWSERSHRLEYLASLYGKHEKMKHLAATDPWRYNEGDVVETANVWDALAAQAGRDTAARWVYEHSVLPLVPIILEAHKRGIAVAQEKVLEVAAGLDVYEEVAGEVAEAYAGYPINLSSPDQLKTWLTQMEGHKVKGVGEDELAALRSRFLPVGEEDLTPEVMTQRLADGAHPLIEARALHSGAKQIESHYLRPMVVAAEEGDGRVYPKMHPWTQANGRWSIVDPPMQQLPKVVKPLVVPDKGWPWFMWDWSQAELRLIAALSNDEPLLEAFEKGWDVHTLHVCQALGYEMPSNYTDPHKAPEDAEWRTSINWKGKEDPRRTFGKQFIFRLCYGGDPRFALDIPGARAMGFDGAGLEKAAKLWLKSHPAIEQYWRRSIASGLKKGESRNFLGRPRRFLSQDVKGRTRELYNHPLQSGVADIKNLTIIAVWDELPRDEVHFVYECHDFLCYAVREDTWDRNTAALREIAERPVNVNGTAMQLVADFNKKRSNA